MKIPNTLLRYGPILLLLSIIVTLAGDQVLNGSLTEVREKSGEGRPAIQMPDHDAPGHTHADDHADPENVRRMAIFHYNEGNKSLKEGKFLEAEKNYRKALRHNPDFQEAYINLSAAYLKAGDYDKAFDALQSLEKINPSNPFLAYNLAGYYSLTGKTDSALNALKKAVDLGYKDFDQIESDPDLENLRREPGFKEWKKTRSPL